MHHRSNIVHMCVCENCSPPDLWDEVAMHGHTCMCIFIENCFACLTESFKCDVQFIFDSASGRCCMYVRSPESKSYMYMYFKKPVLFKRTTPSSATRSTPGSIRSEHIT